MQLKHLTTTLLAAATLLSSSSAAPADAATTVVVTSTSASASASASATPSPPSFALGTLYNRGGYSTQYIIWSPTVNTTASQCNSPYNIAVTSAYTGPNHPFCNYPFDFDGYKNLTLQCGSSSSTFETGQVTGILQSNGVKTWSCTYTPYTKVQPYRCPLAGVDPGYLPQLSQFYICQ